MTTMTVQIPNSEISWFEQMIRAMGWKFITEEAPKADTKAMASLETDVDKLVKMFRTDRISQEDINEECELVREELYNEREIS